MSKKNLIAAAVASVSLTAFGAAAQADTLIAPSSTTYEYTNSGGLQIPDSAYNGSSSTFYTQGQAEIARESSLGAGTLNDGLVGNQAYLDTPGITQSGKYGARTGQPAYKFEGTTGQTGANGIANTATQVGNSSVYYTGNTTIVFDLGASHSNLSTVTIYGDWDGETGWGAFQNISITDTNSDPAVLSTWDSGSGGNPPADVPGGAAGTYGAQGYYFANTINISSLSGEFITLAFTNVGGGFANINEIQFATTGSAVPEPASLSLLGIGALGLMRRRSRRVR